MRKVFLDNLPKRKYSGSIMIDWKSSVGYNVKFIYDDIEEEIKIIDYNPQKLKITTKYKEICYTIGVSEFKNCKIQYCIGIKSKDYKYNIGDIIKTRNSDIEILDTYRKKINIIFVAKKLMYISVKSVEI